MGKVYAQGVEGIELNSDCLKQWNCSLSIYQTLWLRENSNDNSPKTFVQDIFLGATMFIGTMAVIAMLVSGMMMVFGGWSEGMYEKGKKWFKYAIIWLLLVIFSYTLIRVVQYVAQGRGG